MFGQRRWGGLMLIASMPKIQRTRSVIMKTSLFRKYLGLFVVAVILLGAVSAYAAPKGPGIALITSAAGPNDKGYNESRSSASRRSRSSTASTTMWWNLRTFQAASPCWPKRAMSSSSAWSTTSMLYRWRWRQEAHCRAISQHHLRHFQRQPQSQSRWNRKTPERHLRPV